MSCYDKVKKQIKKDGTFTPDKKDEVKNPGKVYPLSMY
jgi:hypothetical protein